MNDNNSNFLVRYIPNTITVLSLCCGFSSIRFSINEDWKTAILLIIFAAIFDFFDGWFASKLKGGSYFGAELDSLSDKTSWSNSRSKIIPSSESGRFCIYNATYILSGSYMFSDFFIVSATSSPLEL